MLDNKETPFLRPFLLTKILLWSSSLFGPMARLKKMFLFKPLSLHNRITARLEVSVRCAKLPSMAEHEIPVPQHQEVALKIQENRLHHFAAHVAF